MGWSRSEAFAHFNIDQELEVIGPATPQEVKDLVVEIQQEGGNFVNVPAEKADWPFYTMGRGKMPLPDDDCGN